MRIESGKVDIYKYFVAIDASGNAITGLSANWVVYRSRNGGAATLWTTPTIAEISAANCPGLYALLIDEDTTIASTSDTEELALHITNSAGGMKQTDMTIELYRPDVTSGKTLLVDNSGRVDVAAVAGTAQTARDLGAQLDAAVTTRLAASSYTAPDNTSITAIKAKTDNLPSDPADASDVAGLISGVDTHVLAVKAKTDNLPSDPADASDIASAFSSVATTLGTLATAAALATVNTLVTAVKAKTDNLPAAPAATGDIPTANQNADALLDRTDGIESSGWTLRKALRVILAAVAGKASGLSTGTGTARYRDVNDTKDRITATVDHGNRTAVTPDGT